MDSSPHENKDQKHGRPQGTEADTGKKDKEMSEQSSSQDQGNKHNQREEEHVGGGRERADPAEYLDMDGMTPAAFLVGISI